MGNGSDRGALSAVTAGRDVEREAPVLDIFSSRQGEGIRVGEQHIFVRFGGCNVVCDYCDTPESIPARSGTMQSVDAVVRRVSELKGQVVSLTGGEPLIQVGFLERLIPRLRERGYQIYLETNGTLPRALVQVVEGCDWIAMDVKPESTIARDMWEAHRWFLETAGKKAFVKLVLTAATSEKEVQRAVTLIAGVRRDIPFVLQPATPQPSVPSIPLSRLVSWWELSTRQLSDVRLLPQIHRLWEIP